MSITISEQFRDLIFPLAKEELVVLEQSILRHGVRDPLVVWEDGRDYLIDGHHRWGIIKKHNITNYKVVKLKFASRYEVINWILDNQLGRRNATPEGLSYLRGLRYRNEKLQHGGPRKASAHFEHLKTAEHIAEQYKISSVTIRRDEEYADALDKVCKTYPTPKNQKDTKHKILSRQINLSKKDIIELAELPTKYIKQVLSGDKDLWQVKLEIEQQRKQRKKKPVRIILPEEIKLYQGDCLKVLPKLEENSIDAALLDPPYGIGFMGKEWDNFTPDQIDRYNLIEQAYFVGDRSPALKAGLYDLSYEGAKKYQKWCSEWGKELLRVMKPGAHILCFCSPRMYHRLCCGLEDSGWQVRNTLLWIFGTGFPMSMSISPKIDKFNGQHSKAVCENPSRKNRLNWNKSDKNIVAPVTPEAEEWDGWGTHLKSSFEPILLARKPLSKKTVAENVLKWGTGVLNIEASRIGIVGGTKAGNIKKGEGRRVHNGGISSICEVQDIGKGRFPSNVLINEIAGVALDQQAGMDVLYPSPMSRQKLENF